MDFDLSGYKMCHLDNDMHSVLREKRVVLGLTQKQVADRAKIVLQQYQKIESGERSIMKCSFQIACRIIEALEMNIAKFYHGDYVIGEEVVISNGDLRYKKSGRLTDDDVNA